MGRMKATCGEERMVDFVMRGDRFTMDIYENHENERSTDKLEYEALDLGSCSDVLNIAHYIAKLNGMVLVPAPVSPQKKAGA